jgi:uncharacterized SAM-binding protein YcdF (DUF218 family)
MNTVLREILFLLQPLCLVWLLLTAWLLRMLWKKLWRWSLLPVCAWVILTVVTCTALPSWLMAGLESQYELPTMEEMAGADAIICLGGGVEPSFKEPTGMHLMRGADRLATALSMAISGVAPVLVLGGAGYEHEGQYVSEADAVFANLQNYPRLSFEQISLGVCANTRDEALKVADLVEKRGWKKVLLVTSANHMPRAWATFKKAGVPVLPIPCHYMSSFHRVGEVDWLHMPYAGSLELFDSWFHEWIGTRLYQWRGWM